MDIKDYSEKVPGLYVVYDAVSVQEEKDLVEFADSQTWSGLGIR